MPGDLQVICGSMVGKNHQSPDSTETPAYKETFFLSAVKILRYRALIFVAYAELLALLPFCPPPPPLLLLMTHHEKTQLQALPYP